MVSSSPRAWTSGLAEDDLEVTAFQVFTVRGGRVLGREGSDRRSRGGDLDRPELVASFLRQLYMEREEVPPRTDADRAGRPRCWRSGFRPVAVPTSRIAVPARRQAAPDGGREQRERSVPSAQAPTCSTSGRSRGAVRARRSARPRASTPSASSATTSRTSGQSEGHGGTMVVFEDGFPKRERRLPPVRDQGRARTGRFPRAWRRCSPAGSHDC